MRYLDDEEYEDEQVSQAVETNLIVQPSTPDYRVRDIEVMQRYLARRSVTGELPAETQAILRTIYKMGRVDAALPPELRGIEHPDQDEEEGLWE